MASGAYQAKYAAKRLKVIAKLKEKGHQASFGTRGAGVNDWTPSDLYAETGTAHVFPLEWNESFSGDVRRDDLFFFVSDEVHVPDCTVMLDDGIEYKIMKVKRFEPDVSIVFYEVQVRL